LEINKKGMSKATLSAFRRAIEDANKRLKYRIDYLLIDAYYIPYVRGIRMPIKSAKFRNRHIKKPGEIKYSGNQLAIIKGDEKSISIGAASIIAKVHRDNLMINLSKESKYKVYGWERNKGYGTKEHRLAIKKYGITKLHRKKFVETLLKKRKK
jgi:ribonuclease HII